MSILRARVALVVFVDVMLCEVLVLLVQIGSFSLVLFIQE